MSETPAERLERQARAMEDTAERIVTEAERRAHAREIHQPRGGQR